MVEGDTLEPLKVARNELKQEAILDLNAARDVNKERYIGRHAQRTAVPR